MGHVGEPVDLAEGKTKLDARAVCDGTEPDPVHAFDNVQNDLRKPSGKVSSLNEELTHQSNYTKPSSLIQPVLIGRSDWKV